jgi:hypothetical protein
MAVILYPSGVTESFEPSTYTFTDEEILSIYDDFTEIRTARLYEVPNTWCVWGEKENMSEDDFNKLATDILQENIFCPVLFIHDTQLDPAWMLTDNVILKGYDQFREDLLRFFDQIAENVILESQRMREEQGKNTNLVFLTAVGPTEDKRVLFEFDPHKQSQEFFSDLYFINFANKVREFIWANSKQFFEIFYVYEDKKTVIFTKDEHVEFIVNLVIEAFKKHEKYEYCQEIKTYYEKWLKFKKKIEKKKKKENK